MEIKKDNSGKHEDHPNNPIERQRFMKHQRADQCCDNGSTDAMIEAGLIPQTVKPNV